MKRAFVFASVVGCCALLCVGAIVAGKTVKPANVATAESADAETRLGHGRVATRTAVGTANLAETLRTLNVDSAKLGDSMLQQLSRVQALLTQGEVAKASYLLDSLAQLPVTVQPESNGRVAKAYAYMAGYTNELALNPELEIHFYEQAVRWMDPEADRGTIVSTIQQIAGILDATGNDADASRLEAMAVSIAAGAPVHQIDLGLDLQLESPLGVAGEGGGVGLGPDSYELDNDLASAASIGFRNNGVGNGNQQGRDNSQIQTHTLWPDATNGFDDVDVTTFGLARANMVRIETSEADDPATVDTIIALTNSGGAVLASNDDGGDGFASKLELCLGENDWFVSTAGFFVGQTFEYNITVDVERPCVFENEPNSSCGQAEPLGVGDEINAIHTPGVFAGDQDWFEITLDEDAFVAIGTGTPTSADTTLTLYDGCGGNVIDFDDDGGPGLLSLIETALTAGTYYANVQAFSATSYFPYSISLEVSEPPLTETEPNNFPVDANLVDLDTIVQASISPAGDFDFFSLSVGGDQVVEIETTGSTDTAMNLSSAGTEIACDDDGGAGLTSFISCCLPAGDYTIGVKHFSAFSTGDYDLEIRGGIACSPLDPPACTADPGGFGSCDPFDDRP